MRDDDHHRQGIARGSRVGLQKVVLMLASCLLLLTATKAADVWTYHNDNGRTGQNLDESDLSPATVNKASFGKLFTRDLDGFVYAQPLYLAGVTVGNKGKHNVVFVATEHDSVFAYDADSASGDNAQSLWQVSFINPAQGITTVPANRAREGPNDLGPNNCVDIVPEIGITGTPVIDIKTGTLYVVAKTKELVGGHSHYVQRLHALDVATGAEKFGGPAVIADTICDDLRTFQFVSGPNVPGAGEGNDGHGHVVFNALRQHQRAGLALVRAGGQAIVYVAWAGHCDTDPYHGWVIGFDAQTLKPVAVLNTTPNAVSSGQGLAAGGVWQSGGAPVADAQGALYFTTGNGVFEPVPDAKGFPNKGDYGDSILKLAVDASSSPSAPNINGWGLEVADYFTPFNQAILELNDTDLGSGGTLLLPDQSTTPSRLALAAGKEGTIYLLDRDDMGKFRKNDNNQIVQSLPRAVGRVFGSPAYYNNRVYYLGSHDVLKAFEIKDGKLSTTPVSKASQIFEFPGAIPSISASGNKGGIVWVLQTDSFRDPSGHAILHAYDTADLTNELYNSNMAGTRDQPGAAVKFSVPTIAGGKVYVGTQTGLTVYGRL